MTPEQRESIYLLQKIDCNCNDCGFMKRNMDRLPKKEMAHPVNYGHCDKFDKPVSFIPATCQVYTQDCFVHRKDMKPIMAFIGCELTPAQDAARKLLDEAPKFFLDQTNMSKHINKKQ